jgi:2-phospho-L-lactate/phosphoenolpyruvate guanylyltransferase
VRWTVLLPAKSLPGAKSRLTGATGDAAAHRELVLAIRADTIAAARAAEGVSRLVLVVDTAAAARQAPLAFVQTRPGLNAALAEAAADAATRWPAHGVAALVGDLPALLPDDLAAALAQASASGRAFVPDAAGTGTTLLTALPGRPLEPAFGAGSAARHGAGAAVIAAGASLRHDVDTADDLAAAARLGLGPATTAVLAQLSSSPAVHLGPA